MANFNYDDDDDDEFYEGLFENGHWEWSDSEGSLKFYSDILPAAESQTVHHLPTAIIGPIEFRDDLDVLEQQRFRKRYQRKTVTGDVVTLQDVKDFVLFTAPKAIVTPALVNVLHLPMTERFLRALITYCQYFLQISDEMGQRMLSLHRKIRTEKSDEIECVFRDNLEDLRILVAKEYCSIIIGAGDFTKYHHMGPSRKSCTSTKKERILFESIVRISTQIVWLALGRKLYNQIEMEIHRLFKSEIYNMIAHKEDYIHNTNDLEPREIFVLFGHCGTHPRKLTAQSPLMDEIRCVKEVDYRMMGLGVIHYDSLTPRLRFLERVLIAPENVLRERNVSIGILGLPRTQFDTTLKHIKTLDTVSSSVTEATRRSSRSSRQSRVSASSKGSQLKNMLPLYEDINIPEKDNDAVSLPEHFPEDELRQRSCSYIQRKKWLAYASNLHRLQTLHKKRLNISR